MPPGGPPDVAAPVIVAVRPDSGRTSVKGGVAVFRFDEVVSERPAAATTLGDLFIVSPRQGVPDVSWHREEIRVRPRRGWLPNTTYTVTMLPGAADLRGNARNTGASTFFSTGATVDKGAIVGRIYDLVSGSPANGAVIEARAGKDTTVAWITRADSTGSFYLAHLPQKSFLVRAYVDKNKNSGADPDEPWDTASVTATDSAPADFFVLQRDSTPPRLISAVATDSVTILVTLDRPADSASATNAANYVVTASDSATVPILAVRPPPRDTAQRRSPPGRPVPLSSVTITVRGPLSADRRYRLRAAGIRGLLGQTLPSEAPVTAAPPAPATVRPPPNPALPGGAVPMPTRR